MTSITAIHTLRSYCSFKRAAIFSLVDGVNARFNKTLHTRISRTASFEAQGSKVGEFGGADEES